MPGVHTALELCFSIDEVKHRLLETMAHTPTFGVLYQSLCNILLVRLLSYNLFQI